MPSPYRLFLLILLAGLGLTATGRRAAEARGPVVVFDVSGRWTGEFRTAARDVGVVDAYLYGEAGGRAVQGGFTLFSDFTDEVTILPLTGRILGRNILDAQIETPEKRFGTARGRINLGTTTIHLSFRYPSAGRVIRGSLWMRRDIK